MQLCPLACVDDAWVAKTVTTAGLQWHDTLLCTRHAGLAPPTPLAEEQALLFFHGDGRVQPALLVQLAQDAERRMIDWKIVRSSCVFDFLGTPPQQRLVTYRLHTLWSAYARMCRTPLLLHVHLWHGYCHTDTVLLLPCALPQSIAHFMM